MNDHKKTDLYPQRLLEVIVTSVDDAIAAERGGAGRLEVISNFAVGGLTPAPELVKEIQAAVSIPLRVMLRANSGFEIANQPEYENLCREAAAFATLGVDGLVLGFLRNGDIDEDSLKGILSCAPKLKVTFHRAFERVPDPLRAIASLKQLHQLDRILTSGGSADWQQNVELLTALQKCADPEITIVVGGGLDMQKLAGLCAATELREFHLGRAVREGQQIDGAVCANDVKAAIQLIS